MTKRKSAIRQQVRTETVAASILATPTDRIVRTVETLADSWNSRLDRIESTLDRFQSLQYVDKARLRALWKVNDRREI